MWRSITYWYTLFHIKTKLSRIEVSFNSKIDPEKPTLLLGNHFSLWDGFLALYVTKKWSNKNFNFLINQKEYNSRSFLKKIGGIGLEKDPKKLIQQFGKINQLLSDKNQLILHYPQNQFESLNISQAKHQDFILKRLNTRDCQVLYMHTMVEFENSFKPIFTISISELNNLSDIDKQYQSTLKEHQQNVLNRHRIQ